MTGTADYSYDTSVPDMAYGVVVRSERAHARILEIVTEQAKSMPGVLGVVTAGDLGKLFPRFGHIVADHPILAIEKVRFYGEPVALVVADSIHAASDASREIQIRYEDLPAVIDTESALAIDAPILHDSDYRLGDRSFEEALPAGNATNVAHETQLEWGDVDAGFNQSDVIVETTAHFPMLYAYAMEPYNALALFSEGGLEVTTTAQHPFQVREDLARIFALPLSSVRVRSPFLGGGYGSKSYTKVEPLAAIGAWLVGRPVKVALNVEEAIYTTRADSGRISVRSGFRNDGTIVAREFQLDFNSGAYTDNSPLVIAKAVNRCFGPYRVPNLRVAGRSVYTNTTPASSYRGFGAPQGALAGEMNMGQAAEKLGIDPAEIRRRNLVAKGEEVIPGKRPMDADLAADLEMILGALDYDTPRPAHHGIGFSCSASDAGAFPVSTASVRILPDSSVILMSGSSEMGQGSRTALAQIAATELGVPLASVRVVQSDTAVTPYERTTGASRTTTLTGTAVIRACGEARRKIEEMAQEVFDSSAEDIESSDGVVTVRGRGDFKFGDVITKWFGTRAGEVTGIGIVRKADDFEQLPPFWEIGMVGVEVSVDPDTGYVTIERLATVGDVGFAINPAMVEGQDLGAATQGFGAALFEELLYDDHQPINPNVVEYRIPRMRDVPRRIETMLAERRDGTGPYGAKGSGEGALNPMPAAVATAVAQATGRWPDRLPLLPERVWHLLQDEHAATDD